MMKVSQLSTLWDYINRAMPWTAPKSLTANEVYALTAYMLNLANVVADDFTLSESNISDTQKKMPNRLGMTTAHALWPGKEFGGTTKPDTQGSDCMSQCKTEVKVASFLPDHARNAHGNIAQQNREYGQFRGVNTAAAVIVIINGATKNVTKIPVPIPIPVPEIAVLKSADVTATLNKYACTACHGIDNKIVRPSFQEIAGKQGKQADAVAYLMGKIKNGSSGIYGSMPMPPQSVEEAELKKVAQWIASGAAK